MTLRILLAVALAGSLTALGFLLFCFWGFSRERHRRREPCSTLLYAMKIPPGENEKSSQPKVLELPSPEQRKVKLTGGGSMTALFITAVIAGCCLPLQAQTTGPEQDEIQKLHEMVIQLKARVEQLEKRQVTDPAQPADQAGPISQNAITNDDQAVHEFPAGTTISVALDGYYGYNFNQPTGRVNLLRAYDVSSNSFSLNQANLIIEHAPDLSANRRAGLRVDFQYGQATETLQGSAVNELRPQVYRPIFQAYGTYVFPVGSGLTVDFGKWPSALGVEGNYGKDQINYSRSFYFNFLPFYHMGFRASYNLSDRANLTYWLVNGAQQTEDFNGFKSQAFLLNLKPAKPVSWNLNYYFGEEQRDVVSMLNPGLPAGPTQPGLPVSNVSPTPNGREHIFDSYITWNATAKLTLVGEGDYLLNRVFSESVPSHLGGGAGYARYQLTHRVALAGRGEYLSDRGGLFSGLTQALKETTATTEYKLGEGLLMRSEWRRDFSNRPFFLTGTAGKLTKEQNTATLGLIWWFGQKQGAW